MRLPLLLLLVALPVSAAEFGIASYYSVRSNGGAHTASGEKLDDKSLTAAHPKLPFGTRVRVTRVADGRNVEVRINNRGPYVKGRIIDLSHAAAKVLGLHKDGITKVKVEVVKQ
jgi:rare lipoprotein A